MRALVRRTYGPCDAVAIDDVEVPSAGGGEVLVRVRAAAVNPADVFSVTGTPRVGRLVTGLITPRHPVPGRAFAGTVEAVGHAVSRFQPGDEVCGEAPYGAYAEYVAVPAKLLAPKPRNTSFAQAAAVPLSGVTALQGLRDKGRVAPGDRILINGASGGVGTFAVQIGRSMGAEVTAVCATSNVDAMRALGADHVVDYTREDFTQDAHGYDVVLDLVGNRSLAECRRALAPSGTLVLSHGPPSPTMRRIFKAMVLSPFVRQRLTPLLQTSSSEDLDRLAELIEAGSVTPILDRIYPLDEAVAALRHQHEGHTKGRIVIAVSTAGAAADEHA